MERERCRSEIGVEVVEIETWVRYGTTSSKEALGRTSFVSSWRIHSTPAEFVGKEFDARKRERLTPPVATAPARDPTRNDIFDSRF